MSMTHVSTSLLLETRRGVSVHNYPPPPPASDAGAPPTVTVDLVAGSRAGRHDPRVQSS